MAPTQGTRGRDDRCTIQSCWLFRSGWARRSPPQAARQARGARWTPAPAEPRGGSQPAARAGPRPPPTRN
eukprot:2346768-Pyramimonas_sp.AAC.1